ncbi:MAG TPA: hypothetical protein PLT91_06845 [Clostridia bacterium]|jgi:hypothetical protein|nr:MAG: hypothetical protein BWX97_00539 [Firmicutes bacterium ADurb.Bin146]HOD93598.1 hypothetical protein [Clostridia bacterium]HQM39943.1 hypothetical protein [Clostridia bacterium]
MSEFKKKLIMCIVFALSVGLISGCDNRIIKSNDSLYGGVDVALGYNGLISYRDDLLVYYDYTSGEATVFCSHPECEHEKFNAVTNPDPKCPAVSPKGYKILAAFMSENHLYMITEDNSANSMIVYRADANGENRKIIGVISAETILNGYLIYNNLLIFTGVEMAYKETDENLLGVAFSNILSTWIIDLETLDVVYKNPIKKIDYNIMYHANNNILYYIYHDNETETHEIKCVDLQTFSPLESISIPKYATNEYAYVVFYNESGYYLNKNQNEESVDVVKLNLIDHKHEIVLSELHIKGNATLFSVVGDYYFINSVYEDTASANNWQNYIYNSKDKQLYGVDMAYSGVETRFMSYFISPDGEHMIFITFPGMQAEYRYMRIDDFIAKSSKYVDLRISLK